MKLKKRWHPPALFPPQLQVYSQTEKGHGRIEERKISVLPLKPMTVEFPFAQQIFEIERVRFNVVKKTTTTETVYGITSLTPNQADPQRVLEYNRGHWCIEVVHHIRDNAFAEDKSRIRTGNGPRLMAILRNLAISIIRDMGKTEIIATMRAFNKKPNTLFQKLGFYSN